MSQVLPKLVGITGQSVAIPDIYALCGLEARLGVSVWTSYRNENAGKTFCHFIAQSRWEILWSSLGNETLDDLLMMNTDAVSLSQFNLMKALVCGLKLPQHVTEDGLCKKQPLIW